MRQRLLQTLMWVTLAAAVLSALWLASIGDGHDLAVLGASPQAAAPVVVGVLSRRDAAPRPAGAAIRHPPVP